MRIYVLIGKYTKKASNVYSHIFIDIYMYIMLWPQEGALYVLCLATKFVVNFIRWSLFKCNFAIYFIYRIKIGKCLFPRKYIFKFNILNIITKWRADWEC